MRLIFANRFYWPETPATGQILTDLAEALAADGHEVTVVTSHSGHAEIAKEEIRHGVRILRLRTPRSTGTSAMGKALAWLSFYLAALWRLWHETRPTAVVVAMTDPPLLGIGACLVTALRGGRLVHWAQDIYPEVAMELTGHRWLSVLLPLRNLSWRRASHVVTLGADMADVVMQAGLSPDRVSIIRNPPPSELTAAPADFSSSIRREWGLDGRFVVMYSGNLGRVHDLSPVIEVARVLRDSANVVFVFIGEGPQRDALAAEAARLGLENVQFRSTQPRNRLQAALTLADLHLVTLRTGCERYVFPSKFHGIVAVGRPMLFIGPTGSELARMVNENGLGFVFDRREIDGIANAIERIAADKRLCRSMGDAAERLAPTQRDHTVAGWRNLIQTLELAASARPPIQSSPS